ncbi:MAG: ATP-dependent 6-phosphofructokinase [Eubacteriales bacterium]
MNIGILTSGGDCPGLNAAIRGVAKASYEMFDNVTIYGIEDGYGGLINGRYRKMNPFDFSGILTLGGTILGTSRQPFKKMRDIEDDGIDKVKSMIKNYEKMKLDCLITIGGNGTHKSADMLSNEGLNVIGLPKTIDNDLWGTDVTFGFHTAVDIATDVLDRIHTTADSHGRVMVVELMGHKAGWLNLYAGIAGGADIILIPEIPFEHKKVIKAVENRTSEGKKFSIVAIAEGAMSKKEALMNSSELADYRASSGYFSVAHRVAAKIQQNTGLETRVVSPGHTVRGGSPSPYDRILSTRFGVHAAELIKEKDFGRTVALENNQISSNKLSDIAGKLKLVPDNCEMVIDARNLGISFGD